MGLILKDKLQALMKGYPTVSDKYDVRGATLSAASATGHFGDLVKADGNGFFTVVTATNTVTKATDVAGVLLATNVKLVTDFFGGSSAEALTRPGEAFNLCFKGFVALELKADTVLTTIKEGLQVGLTADGKAELSTVAGAVVMPWFFTGVTETDEQGRLLAEVKILENK
mgnify:CR=1 FL=1